MNEIPVMLLTYAPTQSLGELLAEVSASGSLALTRGDGKAAAEWIRSHAGAGLLVLMPDEQQPQQPVCWVRTDGGLHQLATNDIQYVEGVDNFIRIHTAQAVLTTWLSIKGFEAQIGGSCLIRIHKSYLINLRHTTQITPDGAIVAGRSLPVSRTYRDALMERLAPLVLRKK